MAVRDSATGMGGKVGKLLKREKGIPYLGVRCVWNHLDPQGGNSHGRNFA